MTNHLTRGPFRPDPLFDDPDRLVATLRRRILPLVGRPARYTGGETGAVRRPWDPRRANLLLTFPDAYELGISNSGLRVLYAAVNAREDAYADIAFAPWPDMEERMRAERLPLYGLESGRPARQFDVLGFSLGYELCYTNVLTMLDLAGIPLRAGERTDGDPLVIAGGHCAANPTVMAPFVDLFCIGDGEEVIGEIAAVVTEWKRDGGDRADLLRRVRALPGTWYEGKTEPTRARVIRDLNAYPPPAVLVPTVEAVHDRLSLEVMRGCTRGCRFCQAGMITRPVRERDVDQIVATAVRGVRELGWSEVSLLSLSTCDYSGLGPVMHGILSALGGSRTSLELPSLRVDALDSDLYELVMREKPASFTFAPEAGSQRLRDVINKNVTEQDVLVSAERAFAAGAKKIKLYFMLGLPTETDADLEAAVALIRKVAGRAPRGGSQVTASFSPFAPKAHTPFQWAGQIPPEEIARRNALLRSLLRRSGVKLSLRDPEVSVLEALLGLGDGRLGEVVLEAWRAGARFDGWDEWFDPARWHAALAAAGIDPRAYLDPRDPDDPLPWDGIFAQVDRDFLRREWEKALRGETLSDCRLEGGCERCEACRPQQVHVFARPSAGSVDAATAVLASPAAAGGEVPATGEADAADAPPFDPRNADPADPARERARWRKWRDRAPGKVWYRALLRKTGDAVFWGHLDFQRQLHLALRRSGLPVAYSQGFHPHPLLKFGPPLPVGVVGERELLDIAMTHQVHGWERELNRHLPPDLRFLDSEPVGPVLPESISQTIDREDYLAELPPPAEGGPDLATVRRRCDEMLARESCPWTRRRQGKPDVTLDVRPLFADDMLRAEATDQGVQIRFSLLREPGRAGIPVFDLLAVLLGDALPEPRYARVRRLDLLMRTAAGGWTSPLQKVRDWNRRLWLRGHLSA